MNDELLDLLNDLMEQIRLGDVQAVAYIAINESGECDFGHSSLTGEEVDLMQIGIYSLSSSLEQKLDS